MATQNQGLPNHWDDKTKHFYRKLRGLGTSNSQRGSNCQPLIDKLDECADQIFHGRPIPSPYTSKDIIKMIRAILYILKEEHGLDLSLAKADYKWLQKEIEKEMAQP